MKVVNEISEEEANEMPDIPSSIPFLPHVVSFKMNKWLCKEHWDVHVTEHTKSYQLIEHVHLEESIINLVGFVEK